MTFVDDRDRSTPVATHLQPGEALRHTVDVATWAARTTGPLPPGAHSTTATYLGAPDVVRTPRRRRSRSPSPPGPGRSLSRRYGSRSMTSAGQQSKGPTSGVWPRRPSLQVDRPTTATQVRHCRSRALPDSGAATDDLALTAAETPSETPLGWRTIESSTGHLRGTFHRGTASVKPRSPRPARPSGSCSPKQPDIRDPSSLAWPRWRPASPCSVSCSHEWSTSTRSLRPSRILALRTCASWVSFWPPGGPRWAACMRVRHTRFAPLRPVNVAVLCGNAVATVIPGPVDLAVRYRYYRQCGIGPRRGKDVDRGGWCVHGNDPAVRAARGRRRGRNGGPNTARWSSGTGTSAVVACILTMVAVMAGWRWLPSHAGSERRQQTSSCSCTDSGTSR